MTRAGGRDGFTLIESMVALVVLAAVMLVAQRGIVAARLGLDRARSTIAAEAVARSIVETELDRLAPVPGVRDGETDGIAWRVTAEPVVVPLPAAPPPPANSATAREATPTGQAGARDAGDEPAGASEGPSQRWRTLRVTVMVANGRGRPLVVETIHLAKEL
ncbi:PulJ/GspJ family protein [Hansschlegelia zhihuaiae]|uniref:Type II secretion system protein n=1 Tax=Hansschlegelia zhihuaiae TaxID=405005 RepID=A0A4Q0MB06_9HYPH|nr:type II secretion system protein [Hansschlegelia zhihuaiae]RXF70285.1 type II secretion system protein [Hansschlegelia zhihuaiae]